MLAGSYPAFLLSKSLKRLRNTHHREIDSEKVVLFFSMHLLPFQIIFKNSSIVMLQPQVITRPSDIVTPFGTTPLLQRTAISIP